MLKAMVIYDSGFGNTEKIAQAIGRGLGPDENVEVLRVGDVKPERMVGLSLLIVGSPTQRFRPTLAITEWLDNLPMASLSGIKVAAFDTRFTEAHIEQIRILAFFVRIFGYAARPIGDKLQKKGGELLIAPEGFYVRDTEGPLLDDELERAQEWAKQLLVLL